MPQEGQLSKSILPLSVPLQRGHAKMSRRFTPVGAITLATAYRPSWYARQAGCSQPAFYSVQPYKSDHFYSKHKGLHTVAGHGGLADSWQVIHRDLNDTMSLENTYQHHLRAKVTPTNGEVGLHLLISVASNETHGAADI